MFGVPMSVILQRSGQPLPKSILFAMNYLQRTGKCPISSGKPYHLTLKIINARYSAKQESQLTQDHQRKQLMPFIKQ